MLQEHQNKHEGFTTRNSKTMKLTTTHLMFAGAAIIIGVQAPSLLKQSGLNATVQDRRTERKQTERMINEDSRKALTLALSSQRAVLRDSKNGGKEVPLFVGMPAVDPATFQSFTPGTVVASKQRTVGIIGDDRLVREVYTVSAADQTEYIEILKQLEASRTRAGINGTPSISPY
jgi:hypothetical protein